MGRSCLGKQNGFFLGLMEKIFVTTFVIRISVIIIIFRWWPTSLGSNHQEFCVPANGRRKAHKFHWKNDLELGRSRWDWFIDWFWLLFSLVEVMISLFFLCFCCNYFSFVVLCLKVVDQILDPFWYIMFSILYDWDYRTVYFRGLSWFYAAVLILHSNVHIKSVHRLKRGKNI